MVAAARRRVRRRAAAHGDRQAHEDEAARGVPRLSATHRLTIAHETVAPRQLREQVSPGEGDEAGADASEHDGLDRPEPSGRGAWVEFPELARRPAAHRV